MTHKKWFMIHLCLQNQMKLSFPNNLVLPSDQLILYSEDFISDLDFLELSITTTPETFCENFRRDECYFAFSDKTRINSRSFYEPRLSWWLITYFSRKGSRYKSTKTCHLSVIRKVVKLIKVRTKPQFLLKSGLIKQSTMKTCKLLIMAKLKFAWAHLPTQTRIHLG